MYTPYSWCVFTYLLLILITWKFTLDIVTLIYMFISLLLPQSIVMFSLCTVYMYVYALYFGINSTLKSFVRPCSEWKYFTEKILLTIFIGLYKVSFVHSKVPTLLKWIITVWYSWIPVWVWLLLPKVEAEPRLRIKITISRD